MGRSSCTVEAVVAVVTVQVPFVGIGTVDRWSGAEIKVVVKLLSPMCSTRADSQQRYWQNIEQGDLLEHQVIG